MKTLLVMNALRCDLVNRQTATWVGPDPGDVAAQRAAIVASLPVLRFAADAALDELLASAIIATLDAPVGDASARAVAHAILYDRGVATVLEQLSDKLVARARRALLGESGEIATGVELDDRFYVVILQLAPGRWPAAAIEYRDTFEAHVREKLESIEQRAGRAAEGAAVLTWFIDERPEHPSQLPLVTLAVSSVPGSANGLPLCLHPALAKSAG